MSEERRVADVHEDIAEHVTKAGFDFSALAGLINALLPIIVGLIKSNPPKPAPVPDPVVVVPVAPPVPVTAVPHVARIVGGHAKITGITDGGPLGPRVAGDRLAEVLASKGNAPHDARIEVDCTPSDGVSDFGADDPRWAGQPSAPHPGEGPIQPMRLKFTYAGTGSADLAHEYANYGCTPRIRVRTPVDGGGALTDIYFEGPDYGDGRAPVRIDVSEGPIFVGRGA